MLEYRNRFLIERLTISGTVEHSDGQFMGLIPILCNHVYLVFGFSSLLLYELLERTIA